jgi:spore germination protein KC
LSWFFIARGEARDIIEAEHEQEKIPSKALESLAKASSATSTSVQVNLHEFLKTLASKTTDPVADWIEIIAAEEIEKEAQGSAKGEESKESKPKKRMRLTDAAVFKNDKLVGCLNRPETRGSIGYSVR